MVRIQVSWSISLKSDKCFHWTNYRKIEQVDSQVYVIWYFYDSGNNGGERFGKKIYNT